MPVRLVDGERQTDRSRDYNRSCVTDFLLIASHQPISFYDRGISLYDRTHNYSACGFGHKSEIGLLVESTTYEDSSVIK